MCAYDVSKHPTLSVRALGAIAMSARTPSATSSRRLLIDPSAPYEVARLFLGAAYYSGSQRTLHHHRGTYYAWNGSAYLEISLDELRSKIYEFLDICWTGLGNGEKIKPNSALVNSVLDALTGRVELESTKASPSWIGVEDALSANEIFACSNGLLHLPTRKLLSHTPSFYTHNAVSYPYDPRAEDPQHWLSFLSSLWPNDQGAIATMQEMFGYCLTGDTSQQKAFLMIGPKRSGKSTIARVLGKLIGPDNVVSPSLNDLSSNFGIAPLIGKRLAIISDARLGARANQHAIAERLLSITGEDAITVDRKYLSAWTGRLQVRFLIISNELPRLADASGALASRFILLTMRNSFYGSEDQGLLSRILPSCRAS